ncbi:MAG TPA: ATP-binding protein [Thermotogota bacterium]|nr:ATP-binding protein [Thermotogota bacterium]
MIRVIPYGSVLKKYLLGFLFAVLTLALFTFLFYIVQSDLAPIDTVFRYIEESNYTNSDDQNYFVNIEPETEDKVIIFKLPVAYDAIMFEPTYIRDVELFLINEEGERTDGLIFHDSSGRLLIDLRNVSVEKRVMLTVKKNGHLILEKKPLAGSYRYLRFFSKFCYLFSGDFSLLIAGMSFLLAFILFSISMSNRELYKAFLALSIATFFYGFLFLLFAVVLNGEGYLAGAIRENAPILMNTYKISNLFGLFFTVIMFSGVEMYISKKYTLTKILLGINLTSYILILFGVSFIDPVIGFINFGFFTAIAYRSGLTFFSYLSFVRPLGELQGLLNPKIYHLYDFDMSNITFFIILFGFGAFFIMDYNKKQKELNIKNEELVSSNEEIIAMNEELEHSYLEIESLNDELEVKVEQRTRQLQITMNSISALLNNTNEGFMKFGSSLLVEPEYSCECVELFGTEIDFSYFPVLLYSSQPDQIQFLAEAFSKIFKESDENKREIMISLLPDTVERNERILSVKYRMITEETFTEGEREQKKMMVILKDITEKISLRDELESEKEIFEEIVKLIANSESFIELREDYFEFWENRVVALLKSKGKEAEIYRQIHTLKGNFASFGFEHLVTRLHEVETMFAENGKDTYRVVLSIVDSGRYKTWMDEEMSVIYEYISPKVFEKQMELREKNEIISRIKSILSTTPSYEDLELVRELLYDYEKSSFDEVFEPTKNFILTTAERLNKKIRAVEVTGGNILVNKQRLKPLFKTWIHLFRNIIDHGLEDPETRMKYGKEPFGLIKVDLRVQDKKLVFEISDDGCGIDFKSVIEKAVQNGIVDRKRIRKNPEMVYDIIFMEGFSTKKEVTEISGRGMGLSAVKKAVESLSGMISVESRKNKGTTFKIIIPLQA